MVQAAERAVVAPRLYRRLSELTDGASGFGASGRVGALAPPDARALCALTLVLGKVSSE